jgi:hypothetical protein
MFGGMFPFGKFAALQKVLVAAAERPCVPFDTWRVRSSGQDGGGDLPDETTPLHESFPWKGMLCFTSVGFDAAISHKFTLQRQRHPHRCNSLAKNKAWYALFGAEELLRQIRCRKRLAPGCISLQVDGEEIDIPNDIDSLQIFNIHSSADGIDFWGTRSKAGPSDRVKDKDALPLSTGDGYLEVVGTGGVIDLLGIRLGVKHSWRLAQGKRVVMRLSPELAVDGWGGGGSRLRLPVQLDGETSLVDAACEIEVSHDKCIPVVLGPGTSLNAAAVLGGEAIEKPVRKGGYSFFGFSFGGVQYPQPNGDDCTEVKVQ